MKEIRQKRMTRQKAAVYDVLCSTDLHPTADWIYQQARQRVPEISLGTVYRNLQVLRDEGRINELNYGKGQSRFDANISPHCHLVCRKCGRVLDFVPQCLPEPSVMGAPGEVESFRFECYGICNDCLAEKSML